MDAVRCQLIWPYRLGEGQLPAYLRSVERILETGQFRSHDGWSGQAAQLLHDTVGLPADWSALPVRSGTDALVLALKAAGVTAGDAVGVPDLAYEAVATAVLRIGARPVWFDVDEQTWNLSEATVFAAAERVRAVIGVDNFGSPCDWQGISLFCREHDIPFILDSCESLGARHPGGAPSDYASLVAYSFSFSKPIHAAGTGGALCGPTELIDRIGKAPEFATWATTMPEINASFLVHAWRDLDPVVEHLELIYRRYEDGLRELGAVPQGALKDAASAWILAPFRFPAERWETGISNLLGSLARAGIMARRSFPPQSRRFELPPGCPTAARLSGEIVCLPTGATMPIERVDEVVECLVEASTRAIRTGRARSGH